MKIFRAIGLGLVILILQSTMGNVFSAFEHTLIQLFATTTSVLEIAQTQTASLAKPGGVNIDLLR